jgi:hypothetical protein
MRLTSFFQKLSLFALLISMSLTFLPAVAHAAPIPNRIWSCQAENGTRKYMVDQINPNGTQFDLAIFSQNKGDERDYIGTITIEGSQTDTEYRGKGVTYNSTIDVVAFGRGPNFGITDSTTGSASGKCSINWQMADNQTRRLVRQCLASASQKFDGNISEVTRFACTNDPAKVIESLK